MTSRPTYLAHVLLTVVALVFVPVPRASAQPLLFGSLDDPREASRVSLRDRERHVDLQGGLSLIGAQWRTAGRADLLFEGPRSAIDLEITARAGVYGSYREDFNELYDLLRLVRYARLDPTPTRPVYARLGPLGRTRIGSGHLVDFLSGETAWDDRRVGFETRIGGGPLTAYAFAQDIRVNALVGLRTELRPLARSRVNALNTLTLGTSWVADRATFDVPGIQSVEAWQADIRLQAARSGAFSLEPFVSFARYTHYGRGLLFGADFVTENFIDVARLQFRLAVHYGGRKFIPGYFGAFYGVHNELARIVSSDLSGIGGDVSIAGIPLRDATGGNDVLTELRLHIIDRFELWYAFKRHYGLYPISEYHLRLYLRARRFRFSIGQDRGDLKGFFSVFKPLGDLSSLHFSASYRTLGRIWIHTEARYTYERTDPGNDADKRYLVQRWFEPYVGLRIPL